MIVLNQIPTTLRKNLPLMAFLYANYEEKNYLNIYISYFQKLNLCKKAETMKCFNKHSFRKLWIRCSKFIIRCKRNYGYKVIQYYPASHRGFDDLHTMLFVILLLHRYNFAFLFYIYIVLSFFFYIDIILHFYSTYILFCLFLLHK